MDKKLPAYSNKPFDYKLPLIKQTVSYNYACNPVIRKVRYNIQRSRPKMDFNATFSSLSIKGINDSIKNPKIVKGMHKKQANSVTYIKIPVSKKIVFKKKIEIPDFAFENKGTENFEIKGWEVN